MNAARCGRNTSTRGRRRRLATNRVQPFAVEAVDPLTLFERQGQGRGPLSSGVPHLRHRKNAQRTPSARPEFEASLKSVPRFVGLSLQIQTIFPWNLIVAAV